MQSSLGILLTSVCMQQILLNSEIRCITREQPEHITESASHFLPKTAPELITAPYSATSQHKESPAGGVHLRRGIPGSLFRSPECTSAERY